MLEALGFFCVHCERDIAITRRECEFDQHRSQFKVNSSALKKFVTREQRRKLY